jgi:hypothetical protein
VSVVVANGADRAGLAGRTAADLRDAGYVDVVPTDALRRADRTTIFYAPGFEDEAVALAGTLGVWAPLEPKPSASLTVNGADEAADLVLLLAPSA